MQDLTSDPTCSVALPEFEGPLDLLLHLVKRHELSILEIPIAFITERYLEYLELMRLLNVDVASEYLLMAATLAHLKSRELLPRQEEIVEEDGEDEEGDPRQELIRRLLEYQRYKEAAVELGDRPTLGKQVFLRGAPLERPDPKDAPLAEVSTFELLAAFAEVLERRKVDATYEISTERISISDRINQLVDLLSQRATLRFVDVLSVDGSPAEVKHQLVVTFLAILEMAKLRLIRVLQEVGDGTIYLTRQEGAPATAVAPAPPAANPEHVADTGDPPDHEQ